MAIINHTLRGLEVELVLKPLGLRERHCRNSLLSAVAVKIRFAKNVVKVMSVKSGGMVEELVL